MAHDTTHWAPIRQQYLHGYRAGNPTGLRTVEVVRAYSYDWRVFKYVAGVPQRDTDTPTHTAGLDRYLTAGDAKKHAAAWLREEG